MANLKNITELPVAESADGLNLIVNDNGSAKQIAASAVGAQADWAETVDTSAAFIKNKPTINYVMKPAIDEIMPDEAGDEIICTANYDEMAKVIENGGHVSFVVPAGMMGDGAPPVVLIPFMWMYMEGAGLMAMALTGDAATTIVFTNGTYIPNFE